ncbi:MAG TPA: hypothetical protein VME63_16370 [Dyella sp.]|uniref:hypothetical protein n=1 Tax=Dyella sp. TaxID=1869338 RepID=UPI002D00B6DD|nr:hypothetical protein [Dyella sp.]HTV86976.1 hypothetical protein [Dyella sp.]
MNTQVNAMKSIFTNKIVVWVLAASLIFLFMTLAGCILTFSRDIALDYACIVLGFASGIVALAPIFFPKLKGILCVISALFLVGAALCFLDKYKEYPLPFVLGFLSLSVLMLATLIYVSVKRRGVIGMGYDAHFTLIIFVEILMVTYAIFFAAKNTDCLLMNKVTLCKIWYWW